MLIGKPGLKSIADLKGKTISAGADNDITTVYFERMMAANGLKKGDYDNVPRGRRSGPLCRAQGRRRRCRDRPAAAQLPGRQAGFVTLGLCRRLREGPSFHRHGDAPALGRRQFVGRQAHLAATDKSVAWLADPAHRGEAIELLVKVGRSSKDDAEASYDYLRRIEYFEPASKVSRAKLRNLVEMEQRPAPSPRASTSSAWRCRASPNSTD